MSVSKSKSVSRYSDEVRETAVKLYMQERNLTEVARLIGVHKTLIKDWTTQDWFKELLEQYEIEQAAKLSKDLRSVATDSIEVVRERLKTGDAFYDQKRGEWVQKPIPAREAAKITTSFIDAINKVEKPIRERQIQADTKNSLQNIADQFKNFAEQIKKVQKPTVQVTDVITIKE